VNAKPQMVDHWFTPGRFALLTACLIMACFPGVIAGRDTFFFRDFAIFSYPLAAYHKECFWHAQMPLWNPYNDCGLPFLAQWNTMALYPLSLIYLLFPLPWSLNFFCLFHMWLGGLGMYFLARAWSSSQTAATLAGLAFLFSGVVLSCLKWPNNIAALGWMPWVVWWTERAHSGNMRVIGVAALINACQMLTGAPEIIALTWGAVGALTIYRILQERRHALAISGKFVLLVALVAGLCAAQLLPFVELLQNSQRDASFRGSQWPMPPWGWANFLLPLFRMFPSYHNVQSQPGQFWISTYYVSIVLVLLAVIAISKVRSSKVWLLGALLLFSMWMALGEHGYLYTWLRATVPGIGMMRFPIKFVVLADFLLPLLGAIGLKYLMDRQHQRAATIWTPALLLGAIIAGLVVFNELNPFRYGTAFLTTSNGLWRLVFLVATAMLLIPIAKRGAVPLLCLLVVADGLTHTTWENPVAPRWVYEGSVAQLQPWPELGKARAMISPEAAETVDHLKLDSPAEDVMASRLALYCNVNLLERIPKVDGFFALYPREIARVQDFCYSSTNLPPAGILDFLGVNQITARCTWKTWEHRDTALPLITSPPFAQQAPTNPADLFSTNWNPRELVFLERIPGTTNFAPAKVEHIDWSPHRITVKASAPGPSLLVFAQTFYPAWKATIDSAPTSIFRANGAFQCIQIPTGSHEVVLVYSDRAFHLGVLFSSLSAATVCLLLWKSRNRASESSTPPAQPLT
jgi:hypothetical protein